MTALILLFISLIVFMTAPLLHAAEAEAHSDHGSALQEILLGMRERAQIFGGRITVTGTPGIGTNVAVEIPPSSTTPLLAAG